MNTNNNGYFDQDDLDNQTAEQGQNTPSWNNTTDGRDNNPRFTSPDESLNDEDDYYNNDPDPEDEDDEDDIDVDDDPDQDDAESDLRKERDL